MTRTISPSLEEVTSLLSSKNGNCIPIFTSLPADLLTPVIAYLKIAEKSQYSFLLESIVGGESLARYSFIGSNPFKIIKTGLGYDITGDPLKPLEAELATYKYVSIPEVPTFTGGAIGFVTYDCVHHFEPKTKRELKEPFQIPEAVFMLCDTILVFDHIYQSVKVVSHVVTTGSEGISLAAIYEKACEKVRQVAAVLQQEHVPLPPQPPIKLGYQFTSNVGKEGYEGFVTKLKEHIVKGDIIQAVPSQRLSRPTSLHPFNVYRHLRQVNPSPYMFYLQCDDIQLVGASPECLCKVDDRKVYNHAIAGTVKRGKTDAEDLKLGEELFNSVKDRAEHIMLVDLARNDVNRICKPDTVQVDTLMQIEKFSHVIHMTSQISGELRDDKSRFDAFRSIFPAGTVSGAPKIKAIEIVGGLEQERRGVYAGAVGRFDFDENSLDTCIAIRTMTFKDGVAYLQAGGGIVYDSVEEDEYIETMNKLASNLRCLEQAEAYYAERESGSK